MRRRSSIKPGGVSGATPLRAMSATKGSERTPLRALSSVTKENIRRKKEEDYARQVEEERRQQQEQFQDMVLKAEDPFSRRRTLLHTPPAPSSTLKSNATSVVDENKCKEAQSVEGAKSKSAKKKTPGSRTRSTPLAAATRLSMGGDDTMDITVPLDDTVLVETVLGDDETSTGSERDVLEPIDDAHNVQDTISVHAVEEKVQEQPRVLTPKPSTPVPTVKSVPTPVRAPASAPASATKAPVPVPASAQAPAHVPMDMLPVVAQAYAVAEVVGLRFEPASFGSSGAFAYAQEAPPGHDDQEDEEEEDEGDEDIATEVPRAAAGRGGAFRAEMPLPFDEIPVGGRAHRRGRNERLSIEEVLEAFREDPVATESALIKASLTGRLLPADFRKFVKAFRSPPRAAPASGVCVDPLNLHRIMGTGGSSSLASAITDMLTATQSSREAFGLASAAVSNSPRQQVLDMLESEDSPSTAARWAGFACRRTLGRTPEAPRAGAAVPMASASTAALTAALVAPRAPAPTPASEFKPQTVAAIVARVIPAAAASPRRDSTERAIDEAFEELARERQAQGLLKPEQVQEEEEEIPYAENDGQAAVASGTTATAAEISFCQLNTSIGALNRSSATPLSVGKWTTRELSQAEAALRRASRSGPGDSSVLQPLQQEIERLRLEMARQREQFENVVSERSTLLSRLESVETRVSAAAAARATEAMQRAEARRIDAGLLAAQASLARLAEVRDSIRERRLERAARLAAEHNVQLLVGGVDAKTKTDGKAAPLLPSPGGLLFKRPTKDELLSTVTSAFHKPQPRRAFVSSSTSASAFGFSSVAAANRAKLASAAPPTKTSAFLRDDAAFSDQGGDDYWGGGFADDDDNDGGYYGGVQDGHDNGKSKSKSKSNAKGVAKSGAARFESATHSFKPMEGPAALWAEEDDEDIEAQNQRDGRGKAKGKAQTKSKAKTQRQMHQSKPREPREGPRDPLQRAYSNFSSEAGSSEEPMDLQARFARGGNLRFVPLIDLVKIAPAAVELSDWSEDDRDSEGEGENDKRGDHRGKKARAGVVKRKNKSLTIMEQHGRKRAASRSRTERGDKASKRGKKHQGDEDAETGAETEESKSGSAKSSKPRAPKAKKTAGKPGKLALFSATLKAQREAQKQREADATAIAPAVAQENAAAGTTDAEVESEAPSTRAGRARARLVAPVAAPTKRPQSAYQLYCAASRATVKQQYPEAKAAEVIKILADDWKRLAAEGKEQWTEQATSRATSDPFHVSVSDANGVTENNEVEREEASPVDGSMDIVVEKHKENEEQQGDVESETDAEAGARTDGDDRAEQEAEEDDEDVFAKKPRGRGKAKAVKARSQPKPKAAATKSRKPAAKRAKAGAETMTEVETEGEVEGSGFIAPTIDAAAFPGFDASLPLPVTSVLHASVEDRYRENVVPTPARSQGLESLFQKSVQRTSAMLNTSASTVASHTSGMGQQQQPTRKFVIPKLKVGGQRTK